MGLHLKKFHNRHKNVISMSSALLILITILHFKYSFLNNMYSNSFSYKNPGKIAPISSNCDIFKGEWVPNPDAPYYNDTCWAIYEHQNCMKHGRPDTGFLKWRWKPDGCELPVFDPYLFLDMVRNKSLAFVGDSVARNQMQSMICLLSRVEYPVDVSPTDDQFKRWKYVKYNFTITSYWAPFLVESKERDSDGPIHTGLFNLYLDEPSHTWKDQIDEFDYLILNAGHWFFRAAVYYENRRTVGCLYCQQPNLTRLTAGYGYRRAFRTTLRTINGRNNFKGITFLRTFAPSHYENGLWDTGGDCARRRPFQRNETVLEGSSLDMYMIQSEEFRIAQKQGKKKFRLLESTHAMLLRPDGHPGKYWHWANENVTLNDCLHWCLPGPIDIWADFLMHMMIVEAQR